MLEIRRRKEEEKVIYIQKIFLLYRSKLKYSYYYKKKIAAIQFTNSALKRKTF